LGENGKRINTSKAVRKKEKLHTREMEGLRERERGGESEEKKRA